MTPEETCAMVTALPDPKRGERLFVLYTDALMIDPVEVHARLLASHLPRLWIPAAADFIRVAELPILGTGKLDLVKLRALARAQEGS